MLFLEFFRLAPRRREHLLIFESVVLQFHAGQLVGDFVDVTLTHDHVDLLPPGKFGPEEGGQAEFNQRARIPRKQCILKSKQAHESIK